MFLLLYLVLFVFKSRKHFVQLILVNTVILILICLQTAVYYAVMTHIFVMQNHTKLVNSYFITMLSDSSISCYHFASSRVWQKSTRCRACKAVFRPLLHCYYLYIVKKNLARAPAILCWLASITSRNLDNRIFCCWLLLLK